MTLEAAPAFAEPAAARLRGRVSYAVYAITLLLLAATYLLLSPPHKRGYSGEIPWSEHSLLRPITEAMSLWGVVQTSRGVEIKDFAFYLTVAAGLLLLAVRAAVSGLHPPEHRTGKGAWFFGQLLLIAWVTISAASAMWAREPSLALGQSALYGLAIAWAVSLCWTLESRDLARMLWGYVLISSIAAAICVWYYHVRNPEHRPGFPIGNPSSLAGCILPAITIAAYTLIGAAIPSAAPVFRRGLRIAAGIVALVPLLWCFWLTQSRGAIAGLLIGACGLLYILATRRMRVWLLAGLLFAAAGAVWFASTRTQDLAMARGATIRFRVYAWQYAAKLWSVRPISGHGAGAYVTLAGQESVKDRALDPAAFMGEAVEHAHNELFEILTEIGLVGGLTFVGGFLATLAAASALLQANLSSERRWLLYGLTAGVIGLMADAMFGVGLRLPGVPAVFFTLLGVLWAAARSMSQRRAAQDALGETELKQHIARRYGVAAVALICAAIAGLLAVRNWQGVLQMNAADESFAKAEYTRAADLAHQADERLLDPVRRLIAAEALVRAKAAAINQPVQRMRDLLATASTRPADESGIADVLESLWNAATAAARDAFTAAATLNQRAPTFGRPAALAAQSAETLAALYRGRDERESALWAGKALAAWSVQQQQRPFDPQTLLALARNRVDDPIALGSTIGHLRDALRSGEPSPRWFELLDRARALPQFDAAMAEMLRAIQSYGPSSETDALIISGAAEMHRLAAICQSKRGDYALAEKSAATAATLYGAIRSRFPGLESIALAEQAGYAFFAYPDDRSKAIAALEAAFRALPPFSIAKQIELARPIHERFRAWLSAARTDAELLDALRVSFAGLSAIQRDALRNALESQSPELLPLLPDAAR